MPPGTLSDTSKSLSALYVHAPWYSVRHKQITVSALCPCPQVLCQIQINHSQRFMCMPPGTLSDTSKSLSALYVHVPRYSVTQITVSTLCLCPLVLCQTQTNYCQHFMSMPPSTLSDTSKSPSALYVHTPLVLCQTQANWQAYTHQFCTTGLKSTINSNNQ